MTNCNSSHVTVHIYLYVCKKLSRSPYGMYSNIIRGALFSSTSLVQTPTVVMIAISCNSVCFNSYICCVYSRESIDRCHVCVNK